jgi:hypothetical protein
MQTHHLYGMRITNISAIIGNPFATIQLTDGFNIIVSGGIELTAIQNISYANARIEDIQKTSDYSVKIFTTRGDFTIQTKNKTEVKVGWNADNNSEITESFKFPKMEICTIAGYGNGNEVVTLYGAELYADTCIKISADAENTMIVSGLRTKIEQVNEHLNEGMRVDRIDVVYTAADETSALVIIHGSYRDLAELMIDFLVKLPEGGKIKVTKETILSL